jgi:hypothetical protein
MNDEEEDEDASNEMQWILLRREGVMLPTNPHVDLTVVVEEILPLHR